MDLRKPSITFSTAVLTFLAFQAATHTAKWQVIASYRTDLRSRTNSQKHNAALATKAINGKILLPGDIFSFNKTIGNWTADKGYVKAPVSYSGELITSYGGGVCQASTTLYNAALLAGLEIIERHRHQFQPQYISPGRDAAVALNDIDLRIKNPYQFPLKIEAFSDSEQIICRFLAQRPIRQKVTIYSELGNITTPSTVFRIGSGPQKILNRGQNGVTVAVYRFRKINNKATVELISKDTYPSMNRLIKVTRTNDACQN